METKPGHYWNPENDSKKLAIYQSMINGKDTFSQIWKDVGGSKTSLKLYLLQLKDQGLIERKETNKRVVSYELRTLKYMRTDLKREPSISDNFAKNLISLTFGRCSKIGDTLRKETGWTENEKHAYRLIEVHDILEVIGDLVDFFIDSATKDESYSNYLKEDLKHYLRLIGD